MASLTMACRNQQSYVDNSHLVTSDLQLLTSIHVCIANHVIKSLDLFI